MGRSGTLSMPRSPSGGCSIPAAAGLAPHDDRSMEHLVTGKTEIEAREVDAADCKRCAARAHCILYKLRARQGGTGLVPRKRSFRAKEMVFSEGDPCRDVMVVARGTIVIRRHDPAGDLLFVENAQAGRMLECRALLPGARHLASAKTQCASEICSAPADAIRKRLETGGPVVIELLQQAGRELEHVQKSILLRAARPMHARVQLALQMFAEAQGQQREGGEWHVELPVQRRDLAAMVGARPETVSRIIHWMEQEGLARFSGRHVEIPNLELLSNACHSEKATTSGIP